MVEDGRCRNGVDECDHSVSAFDVRVETASQERDTPFFSSCCSPPTLPVKNPYAFSTCTCDICSLICTPGGCNLDTMKKKREGRKSKVLKRRAFMSCKSWQD